MISSPTSFPALKFFAFVAALLVSACSVGHKPNLPEQTIGEVILRGFELAEQNWATDGNRYWQAEADHDGLVVTNTRLGSWVSPVWHKGEVPRDFVMAVRGTVEKEGLDGGWGIEFGTKAQKYGYRVLVYASGRFCIDRLFGLYPEFLHCIPYQPEIETGESTNVLTVKVVGVDVTVSINGERIFSFTDDRYEQGELALAVAGAGTRVYFDDVIIVSLE